MIPNGPITEARAHGTWGTGADETALHTAALYALANSTPNPNCLGEDGVTTQYVVHIAHPGGSDYTGDALIKMANLPDVARVRYLFDSGHELRMGNTTSQGSILGGAGGNNAPNITFGVGDETAGSGRDKGRVRVNMDGSQYTKHQKAKVLIPKQPYMAIEDFEIFSVADHDESTTPVGQPGPDDPLIPMIWTNAANHIRIERCGGQHFPYGYGLIGVNGGQFVYIFECDTDDDGVLARMELVANLHDFQIIGNVGRHGKDVVNISCHAFRMWNGLVKNNIGLGQEYGVNIRQQAGGGFGQLDGSGHIIAGTEVVVQGTKIKNDNKAKRLSKNGSIQPSFYWNEGPGQQPFGPSATPAGVLVSGTIGDESIVAFEGGLNGATSGTVTIPDPPGTTGGGGGDTGVGTIPAQIVAGSVISLPVDGTAAAASIDTITLPAPIGVAADDVLLAPFAWQDSTPDASFTPPSTFDLLAEDHQGVSGAGVATRLYLLSSQANKGSSDGSPQSAALGTPTGTPTGGPVIGDLGTGRGSSQVASGIPSAAVLTAQKLYLGCFRSAPLVGAGGSIAAHTWSLHIAGHESGGPANMKIAVSLRVEKSDGTLRGLIYDSATGLGTELPVAAPPPGQAINLTGSSVASVAATDRLVLEVWAVGTQGQATSYTIQPTRYNGTTDVADGVANSSAAAYIETPQTDLFSTALSEIKHAIYTTVVDATDAAPVSYDFTGPSAVGGAAALVAIRGWDPAAIAGVALETAKGSTAAPSVADVATTVDGGAVLLILSAHGQPARTWPAGAQELFSVQRDPGSAPRQQLSAALLPVPTAGTVTGLDVALSSSTDWVLTAIPLDPPDPGGGGTPTLILADTTIDTSLGRVRTLVTLDPARASAGTDRVTVIAKHPSGQERIVRGADKADPIGDQLLVYDYEVPVARRPDYKPTVYRAVLYDSAADDAAILGTSDLTPIQWLTTDDWISHPLHAQFCRAMLIQGLPEEDFDRRVGVHQVIGRPAPVTTSDVLSSASGTLTVLTLTDEEAAFMREMIAYPGPLLVRSPDLQTGSLFLQPTSVSKQRVSPLRDEPARSWSLPFIEVDRPTDDISGGPFTCQDVLDTYATCQDLLDAVPDCLALIEGAASGVRHLVPWRGE